MKQFIFAAVIAVALFSSCSNKSGGGDQTTPKGVAEMIFSAARNGDYGPLKNLCDDALHPDGDSKHICEVATTSDEKLKSSFKEYFSKGKVVGEPTIEGDKAAVKVLFGPDGTKDETFNMMKKDGKWYMVSF